MLFDRARTGQMLGVQGLVRRSAPMLVIPVMTTGSTAYSFEYRNEWQRAWAQFRTAGSPIDYVRTVGLGHRSAAAQPRPDPAARARLVADAARPIWRGRHRRRPRSSCGALYPGGPAVGIFTARYGPDNQLLGRFALRVAEQRRDAAACSTRACGGSTRSTPGRSTPACSGPIRRLVIIAAAAAAGARGGRRGPAAPRRPAPQVPTGADDAAFNIQVATPDAGAVQQAEVSVSRVDGVTSAITTSLALGGTSVMRVTFVGDAAALQAALQAQGWQVQVVSGNTLRISR